MNKTAYLETYYYIDTHYPGPPIVVLDYFYSCHKIAFHWNLLDKPYNVRGVDIVWINVNNLQIERDTSEWNSGGNLVDQKEYPCGNTTA